MIRSKIMGRKMIRRKIRQCLAFWKTEQKREKDGPGAYRLFLLDLDETYGQEEADSYGVEPVLYLICDPAGKAEQIAIQAVHTFHDKENDVPIGDLFESGLKENRIPFEQIYRFHIPFGERSGKYLEDHISQVYL